MEEQRKAVRLMQDYISEHIDEDYVAAINEIWNAEKKYNPDFMGFEWDDKNPRIQLESIGKRGYIELVPVKKK
jgi:hypothetical protein